MVVSSQNESSADSARKKRISRRDFLKLLGLAGIGTIPGWFYATQVEPMAIELNQLTLKLPALRRAFSGLRIAQISDIHFGGWMNAERLQTAFDLIVKQAPDIVVITGDLVMAYPWQEVLKTLDAFSPILAGLVAQFPVFAVMGNHDHWGDVDVVRRICADAGVRELRNDVFGLERGGEKLYLAGVDDVRERFNRLDLVLERLPEGEVAILLAHEPDFALKSAATGRFALQLSGHTHGGQVVLPWVRRRVLPMLGRHFPAGLYEVQGMYQYTNRGLGMTPPYVRLNCPPEITVFTLESA